MDVAARLFSDQWAGTTKADFIAAAYDIKSGIATLSDEGGAYSGGLKLREGSVEVNCTVDTLLALSRNSLDAEIAAILFD